MKDKDQLSKKFDAVSKKSGKPKDAGAKSSTKLLGTAQQPLTQVP
jgi:hypothetical protein